MGDKEMSQLSLGTKVCCTAYLRKVNDGAFISHIEPHLSEDHKDHFLLYYGDRSGKRYTASSFIGNDNIEIDESSCEGEYDIEKVYYERVEKQFSGFIIGRKDVVVEGYLGVDTDYAFDGTEFQRIFKTPKTVISCAVVAYAMNKKRFVPLEDLNEIYN